MTTKNLKNHSEIVRAENERRRLAKEEADRLAFEKAERKRIKLEMKIRRRENRRLFGLEKAFTEVYAATADIEKDLINVANIDGTDNNGMKSMGLRGGLLGELFFQIKHMRKHAPFSEIGIYTPLFEHLIQNFWHSFVGEGWTVLIGVDPEFDKNITPVLEGTNLDRLDTEYIRSFAGQPIEARELQSYLKIHMHNTFLETRYPGLVEQRDKWMAKVKFVPPTDADNKDDNKDPDKVDDNSENANIEDALNKQPAEPDQIEELSDPEEKEVDLFMAKILDLIFDENANLYNVRFVRYTPKPKEEKKDDQDGGDNQAVPVSRVLAVFIPVPPPAEDLMAGDPSVLKPTDPKIPDLDVKPDGDGDDGADADKKPIEPEILPFVPQPEDFVAEFEAQVSLVDYGKKEMDVSCFHVPLVKSLTSKLYAVAANLLAVEGDLSGWVNEAVLASVEDVQQFSSADRRDVLYINSY